MLLRVRVVPSQARTVKSVFLLLFSLKIDVIFIVVQILPSMLMDPALLVQIVSTVSMMKHALNVTLHFII